MLRYLLTFLSTYNYDRRKISNMYHDVYVCIYIYVYIYHNFCSYRGTSDVKIIANR